MSNADSLPSVRHLPKLSDCFHTCEVLLYLTDVTRLALGKLDDWEYRSATVNLRREDVDNLWDIGTANLKSLGELDVHAPINGSPGKCGSLTAAMRSTHEMLERFCRHSLAMLEALLHEGVTNLGFADWEVYCEETGADLRELLHVCVEVYEFRSRLPAIEKQEVSEMAALA